MAKKNKAPVNIVNRKAKFEYHFDQLFEAGIVLQGTEIKSIRAGQASLGEAYCIFKTDELYIKNMHVSEYTQGSYNNHDPKRERKLLLKKDELGKLQKRVKEKGFTIIPYRLYVGERGYAKLEIALARGKKSFDKRDSIKERDNKRDLDRIKKMF